MMVINVYVVSAHPPNQLMDGSDSMLKVAFT
jgi:hypothetical protein